MSDFLTDSKNVIDQDLDEANKRAQVGLEEASDLTSQFFGKGLLPHK